VRHPAADHSIAGSRPSPQLSCLSTAFTLDVGGDVVRVEIEGIGSPENPLVAEPATSSPTMVA